MATMNVETARAYRSMTPKEKEVTHYMVGAALGNPPTAYVTHELDEIYKSMTNPQRYAIHTLLAQIFLGKSNPTAKSGV